MSELPRTAPPSSAPQPRATSETAIGAAGAERLSNAVIWTYSLPRVGMGIMGLLFGTYLMKFATDVLLIAPAVMGGLLAASRFWDAISDPLAGYLSDRTRSPVGRRRIWMYAAAIPMGAGLVMIWSPPLALEGLWLVAWMGAALLLYETASTAFFVPHGALGVELTPNYHDSTRLFGWSHMIGAIGMVAGLGSLQLMNVADDKRAVALVIGEPAGGVLELHRNVAALWPGAGPRALLIVGHDEELPAGVDEDAQLSLLRKPFDVEALLATVERALG